MRGFKGVFFCSPKIVMLITSIRLRWARQVARIGEDMSGFKTLRIKITGRILPRRL